MVFNFVYGRYIKEGLLSLFSRCHARVCGHPVQVATHVYVSDLLYVMLFNVTRSIFVGYKCQLYHVWISVKFTVWFEVLSSKEGTLLFLVLLAITWILYL